jgi:hypothetical protein
MHEPWAFSAERRGQSLVLASYPVAWTRPAVGPVGDFRNIVWDHSAIGTTVPFFVGQREFGELVLGAGGVCQFAALSQLARLRPALAAAAFQPFGRWT